MCAQPLNRKILLTTDDLDLSYKQDFCSSADLSFFFSLSLFKSVFENYYSKSKSTMQWNVGFDFLIHTKVGVWPSLLANCEPNWTHFWSFSNTVIARKEGGLYLISYSFFLFLFLCIYDLHLLRRWCKFRKIRDNISDFIRAVVKYTVSPSRRKFIRAWTLIQFVLCSSPSFLSSQSAVR